jgi:ABC-type multidrug transport system fused ATPase/permease subunit
MLWVYTTSAGAVLFHLLLVLVGAAAADLLISGGKSGSYFRSWFDALVPSLATPDRQLLAITGLGLFISGLLCLARYALRQSAEAAALEAAGRLRTELRRQTFYLGGSDMLLHPEANPARLFRDTVEELRRDLARWWETIPYAPLLVVSLVAVALYTHFWLAASALLLANLLVGVGLQMAAAHQRERAILTDRLQRQMDGLVEKLKLVRLVSGHLLEDTPGAAFDEALDRYQKQAERWRFREVAAQPLAWLGVLASACLLVWLVGVNVLAAPPRLALAEAVILFGSLASGYPAVRRLVDLRQAAARGEQAADEIYRYLDREPVVGQLPRAGRLPRLAVRLELDRVTVRDGSGRALLDDVSLEIFAGRKVAVFSGESATPHALACLLARFFDPHSGRVCFDDHDIRDVTLDSLRKQIALVLQDGLLFTGSVAENISCGDPRYTLGDIRDAAKRARAYELIQRLPQDFSTTIGEHGVWLEPGERLLIGLARAVLRDPALLVIEEPAESLDPPLAQTIDEAIAANSDGRTVILLATRLDTLRTAEHVLVFHDGRLQGQGTHNELLQSSDLYRHLLYLRFNEYQRTRRPEPAPEAAPSH